MGGRGFIAALACMFVCSLAGYTLGARVGYLSGVTSREQEVAELSGRYAALQHACELQRAGLYTPDTSATDTAWTNGVAAPNEMETP